MYLPPNFREDRPEILRALMAEFPLAALITQSPEGLTANHLPLLYDPEPAPWGTLRGHLARANPQWQMAGTEADALAIFQGPQAYVSPNWYPSKRETGRAVPTWNYAVVHAHGRLSVYSEPERLRRFLDRLTAEHEADQPVPWMPSDAPPEYIDGLLRAIVGIEMAVTRIEGKWKVSQNQPAANRAGAAEGLEALGKTAMASLIRKL
ncbi:MAG: FMN-binding negative transcriptional regulator [Acidobacteriota bacterium]